MGLKRYILKRLVHAVGVIWVVATLVFAAVRAIPGDPVLLLLGQNAPTEAKEALRQDLGLDEPIYVQYVRWLGDLVTGDFGQSIHSGEAVLSLIVSVSEPTVSIAVFAILIAVAIGIPGGVVSAVRQYRVEDYVATVLSFLGISMPGFWIGILLIIVFANSQLVPAFGYTPISEGVAPWFAHLVLPSLAAGLPFGAIIMRMTRSSMLEVLNEDYIRTARAKGLDGRLVVFKHGFQNALIPVVTVVGILLAVVLGGVVSVEIVFGIRGLGRLLIDSLFSRDYPVVQGAVILISTIFVLTNVVVDVVYTMVNPKITYSGGS
jgi:peptide/nickel transport system permease protein